MERIVPRDKWLYNDRGMAKWMGWLLADHSAFLEEHRSTLSHQIGVEMDTPTITDSLWQSFNNSQYVTIQLNILNNNNYVPELRGIVAGFDGSQVFLYLEDDKIKSFFIEEVRHVELLEAEKWWDQ